MGDDFRVLQDAWDGVLAGGGPRPSRWTSRALTGLADEQQGDLWAQNARSRVGECYAAASKIGAERPLFAVQTIHTCATQLG